MKTNWNWESYRENTQKHMLFLKICEQRMSLLIRVRAKETWILVLKKPEFWC